MAITYGMSASEFWDNEPDLFWAYRFSYFDKLKSSQEIFNNNAWLQGAYFNEAISVALCNAFGKTKVSYSNKPYGFDKEDKKDKNIEIEVINIKSRISQINKLNSACQKGKKVGETDE